MKSKVIFILLFFITPLSVFSYPFEKRTAKNGYTYVYHAHNESSYQIPWCKANNGILEFENKDKTRVDCLTKTHAVEFDFANKWAEGIGQALHYGIMTGKKPMVVLILENKQQKVYFNRVKKVGDKYGIDVEYVTNDILNLDETGKCANIGCKCHKTKNKKDIQQKQIQQDIYTVA